MNPKSRHLLPQFLRMTAFAPDKTISSTEVILDSLPFPLAIVDRLGKIIVTNQYWAKPDWQKGIFGDVIVKVGDNYLEACRQAAAAENLPARDALKGIGGVCDGSMPSYELEYACSLPDGKRFFSMTARPLLSRDGGVVIIHREIPRLNATDKSLMEFSGRLTKSLEDERSRIAGELHDNLIQKLALLSIDIEQLAYPPSQSAAIINASVNNVLSKVQDISSEIDRLSQELHPFKLDRLGLAAAVLSLTEEVSSQQSLHVDCDIGNLPNNVPREVALCLYRVIQESLQNIIKCSGACNAALKLHGSRSEIRLRITDDGVGFTPESAAKKHGMGLFTMRERLRLVGGTMSIESQPLRGTRIQIVVPLEAGDSKSEKGINGE